MGVSWNWDAVFSEYGMILLIGMACMAVLLFVMLILLLVTMSKLKKLSRAHTNFMRGKDAESLEDAIFSKFQDLDELKRAEDANRKKIEEISQNLLMTYQKIGIVKYDAFREMGGTLSFALALLDKNNNGFVMNSIHNREGCYTYIKEIIDGKSYIALGEEEKKAVETAVNFNGLE